MCIVRGLKKSRSIRMLQTYNAFYGDMVFSRLFRALYDTPTLEKLYLWEETSITASDLKQVSHMERLKKPIALHLCLQLIKAFPKAFSNLLYCHPELRMKMFCYHPCLEIIEFRQIYELNLHGRYLLDGSTVPMSLWPTVFEKAKEKPNVIYEFLKGPSFAGREVIC